MEGQRGCKGEMSSEEKSMWRRRRRGRGEGKMKEHEGGTERGVER